MSVQLTDRDRSYFAGKSAADVAREARELLTHAETERVGLMRTRGHFAYLIAEALAAAATERTPKTTEGTDPSDA